MPSAVRTGQVGCTGPVKRGKKHISISLKIDDAQYSWITCPEVSVCQCLCCHWKMSRWLSLTMAMNFSVCRQVRCIWLCVALRHLSFSGKLLCWNSFLKTVFGWAANSRKRASDNALHSRVLAFTSKGEEIRRGPELKNTVVCHPSALHQNEGWPPSFVRGSLHASMALSMAAGIKLSAQNLSPRASPEPKDRMIYNELLGQEVTGPHSFWPFFIGSALMVFMQSMLASKELGCWRYFKIRSFIIICCFGKFSGVFEFSSYLSPCPLYGICFSKTRGLMQRTFEISASEPLKGTLKQVLVTGKWDQWDFFPFVCSRINLESLDDSKAF